MTTLFSAEPVGKQATLFGDKNDVGSNPALRTRLLSFFLKEIEMWEPDELWDKIFKSALFIFIERMNRIKNAQGMLSVPQSLEDGRLSCFKIEGGELSL